MSKTAIVTGAPGWLGTRLVESLVKGLPEAPWVESGGRIVKVLSLAGLDTDELKSYGDAVSITAGDLQDGTGLSELFKNAQGATVFHAAGIIHPSQGVKQFYAVNVEGTKRLLEAATQAGVKRFVHVSSNSPIGIAPRGDTIFDENSPYNPYMNYGKSKKLAEDLVNETHRKGLIECVIIRPPWFYGTGQPPRQTLFFSMVKNGKAPIVGNGENLRSMAYVDNICQGLLLCDGVQKAAGKTYWIADSKPYTMNQIVDTIERVLERDFGFTCAKKRMHLPDLASEVAVAVDGCLQAAGLYHQKFHVLSEMNKNIACSIELAQKELGYKPTIALEEGMRRSIDWVLKRGDKI